METWRRKLIVRDGTLIFASRSKGKGFSKNLLFAREGFPPKNILANLEIAERINKSWRSSPKNPVLPAPVPAFPILVPLPWELGVEVVLITPMLRPPPPPTSSDLCFPSSAPHPLSLHRNNLLRRNRYPFENLFFRPWIETLHPRLSRLFSKLAPFLVFSSFSGRKRRSFHRAVKTIQ